jgi:cupin 2 domain-containing protein
MTKLRNLLELPKSSGTKELTEILAEGQIKIERIISTGQITPVDEWYDQDKDEWVLLVEGEAKLTFEDSGEITLKKGDYILIKAHERHRVTYTSTHPPCIWLAIHGKINLTS